MPVVLMTSRCFTWTRRASCICSSSVTCPRVHSMAALAAHLGVGLTGNSVEESRLRDKVLRKGGAKVEGVKVGRATWPRAQGLNMRKLNNLQQPRRGF